MAEIATHPAAPHHLPGFITEPGSTDVVMMGTGIFLLVVVIGFGILFLRLHSLPERIAHKGHKIQFEIVAILCLIALFTHMHIFWIVALLLAVVELPDFTGLLGRMANALEKMAGRRSRVDGASAPPEVVGAAEQAQHSETDVLVPLADAKARKEMTHA
jgi:hypothetical protein